MVDDGGVQRRQRRAGDRAGPRASTRSSRASGATTGWSCPTGSPPRPPARPRTAGSTWSCPARSGRGATRWSRAVRAGEVAEAVIDDHLRRLLRLADRVGALGGARPATRADLPAPDSPVRREQLTRLAAAGHDRAHQRRRVLPLARGARVALIGRHARRDHRHGRRLGPGQPAVPGQRRRGLRALLGDAVTVTDGVEVRTRPVPARAGFVTDPETGEPGVRLTLFDARRRGLEDRHSDRRLDAGRLRRRLPGDRRRRRICGPACAAAGPVEIGVLGAGVLAADRRTTAVELDELTHLGHAASARRCWPRRPRSSRYEAGAGGRGDRDAAGGRRVAAGRRRAVRAGRPRRPAREPDDGDRRGGRGGRGRPTSPWSWSG